METITTELQSDLEAGVLTLTFNRPQTLNSLTPGLLTELAAAARGAATDPDVRCVVLRGAGRGFSSGAALGGDPSQYDVGAALREHYNPAVRALAALDKPTVASIRGIAAGAGAGLALACDLRVAADDARFAFLFRRVGLALDAGVSYHLPRIVGLARAAELALLGNDIRAEEALAIGLVNRVAPVHELDAATGELAATLSTGPLALTLIKRQLRESLENSLEEQLELELETQVAASRSADFVEGVEAFLGRRATSFTGR